MSWRTTWGFRTMICMIWGMARPTLAMLRRRVLGWYRKHGRELPWRESDDPYHSMVAEFMLQQTGVGRVLPVYASFLERFPTLAFLADASIADVIRAWSGMGYNRRAINLQRAARVIVEEHGGVIPRDPRVLETLPGIGRYTAGGDCLLCVSSARRGGGYEYSAGLGAHVDRPQGCGRGDRVGAGGGGGSARWRAGIVVAPGADGSWRDYMHDAAASVR